MSSGSNHTSSISWKRAKILAKRAGISPTPARNWIAKCASDVDKRKIDRNNISDDMINSVKEYIFGQSQLTNDGNPVQMDALDLLTIMSQFDDSIIERTSEILKTLRTS